MWIARIARLDAIYDASAASQTFSGVCGGGGGGGGLIDVLKEKEDIFGKWRQGRFPDRNGG